MYYYIYQITNLLNNKIYIGKHKSTKHPSENGYYGSGKQIKDAIEKYGIENFKKELLYYCNSMEEMSNKELDIVTEEFVKRKDTYNMHKGGPGGWDHYNGSIQHRSNSSKGGKISAKRLNEFIAEQRELNTEWYQEWYANVCKTNKELSKRAQAPKSRAKRKATLKEREHSRGEKNSQFGRIWISNVLTKEVNRIRITDPIPDGWVRGKKGHTVTKCWVNNGVKEHYILLEKEQEYKLNGFSSGRLKKVCHKIG